MNRRDFLKLAALVSADAALRRTSAFFDPLEQGEGGKPNILIFVFDAMSAEHLSLHQYARNTTPNLDRFAQRSNVYHSHYSAGNFTTAGVASMLTGMYPWDHRAINYRGLVKRGLVSRNLFNLIGNEYTRVAFTQNMFAEIILSQFGESLDIHLRPDSFSFYVLPAVQAQDFPRDRSLAYFALEDFLGVGVKSLNPIPGSLPLASVDIVRQFINAEPKKTVDFPRGYPNNHSFYYRNEDGFRGIAGQVSDLNNRSLPWIGYFHVWSPHGPYSSQKDFVGLFPDELRVPFKPRHKLSESRYPQRQLLDFRLQYDEYIANVDAEFGKMMTELERAGVLDNTYIIVTSDHGELFERGELGHGTPLLYNPVTHVPLLISAPGQKGRRDIQISTSSLDLLPTILKIAGKDIPDWVEGKALPGFTELEDAKRSIYSFVAKNSSAFQDINQATISLIKGPHELIFYTGYKKLADSFELYNLAEDQYEKENLVEKDLIVASRMREEMTDMFQSTIKPSSNDA